MVKPDINDLLDEVSKKVDQGVPAKEAFAPLLEHYSAEEAQAAIKARQAKQTAAPVVKKPTVKKPTVAEEPVAVSQPKELSDFEKNKQAIHDKFDGIFAKSAGYKAKKSSELAKALEEAYPTTRPSERKKGVQPN